MITFGEFQKDDEGNFIGEMYVREAGIMDIIFQKNTDKKDNQPDYFAYAYDQRKEKHYPIGKVWEPRQGKQHHFVKLESPLSPQNVITASLFPDKNNLNHYNLIWYPPQDSAPKVEAKTGEEQPKPDGAAPEQGKPIQKQRPITGMIKKLTPRATL